MEEIVLKSGEWKYENWAMEVEVMVAEGMKIVQSMEMLLCQGAAASPSCLS